MNFEKEQQEKLIETFPKIYEGISSKYHHERFSSKRGRYDLSETNIIVNELIHHFYGEPRNLNVLDVGCGTGKVSLPIAKLGAHVVCLDASAGMLEQCNDRAIKERCKDNIELLNASADDLPYETDYFDLVISSRFLHLFTFKMYPIFINEMLRVSKPQGYVVVEIKNRFYGLFVNILRDLNKKINNVTPSSSLSMFQIKQLPTSLEHGKLICIRGCQLPKAQNIKENSNLAVIVRKLSRKILRTISFSFYVVLQKSNAN
jgi:ubiquinone/menaquinone biosynthesis C-methylase UbiE